MDFGLNEEQEMLKTMARDFLTNECPKAHVRKMMDDEIGYSSELWKKMAELGWQGLVFPEEFGGSAMNFRDLAVLNEEMGRALAATPFFSTVMLFGLPILEHAGDELKKEILPKISSGEIIGTMALLEADGDLWAEGMQTKAIKRGESYLLSGTKMFVTDAKAADYFIVPARTRATDDPENNITLFLVDAREWGVYVGELKTMDLIRKQYEVIFKNVNVPAANIIGELHGGWRIIKELTDKVNAQLCAEMIGGCEWVLETTVAYAKERVAFGVPIGSFQALKHRMAQMYSDLEHARPLMIRAVEYVRENRVDAGLAVSMAKTFCADVYEELTNAGVQLHGGNGFTWDHDMHLYFKRARWSANTFGNAVFHRDLVAGYLEKQLL